ncbi:molybdopterin molybdotransferase MoeA [Pseudohongiella spirulinae]|uniref:Molybdopterin molybdenumtransferase n=1 Tax=Pseudohongiella spirulinae TaxID=1249552 RepID=A0A0S2KFQ9_9GAMM|nr:gephyrin-like molybdotransferase Glp [Pseudohongiella spirulinae]ALO47013.1 molybdenum cofactor biosynthesis protein MoaA [Pseudohongiella spirulinae]
MVRDKPVGLMPVATAINRVLALAIGRQRPETVALQDADGRVALDDIFAASDVPPWDNSAMDGYAVRAVDAVADASLAVSQRIPAGCSPGPLHPGSAARIFTGAPLPAGADSVVMQENTELIEPFQADREGQVRILQTASKGENVRRCGADIARHALLVSRGQRLWPADLGLLASAGVASVTVGRLPTVALVTSGSELREPGQDLQAGQIYNSNRYVLQAMLARLGIKAQSVIHLPDSEEQTRKILQQLSQDHDVVISTGGVSVGEEDYMRAVMQKLGQLDIWKLALKPGKPFTLGQINHTLFFGLPGNPVSAFVTFILLVRPALLAMMGAEQAELPLHRVVAAFEASRSGERQEYVRARLSGCDAQRAVEPLDDQSSGVFSSVSRADGLAIIPPHTAVARGDTLSFIAFSDIF